MEQTEFDWAHMWLEEGVHLYWLRTKLKVCFTWVFDLPRPLSLLFYSSVLFLCPNPLTIF